MKLKTLLELGRVSNLPTVFSNVLAATAASQMMADVPLPMLFSLFLSMALFYLAGMFLNDAYDAEFDRAHDIPRPIVLGKISRSAVFTYGFSLMTLALLGVLGVAFMAGDRPSLAVIVSGILLAGAILIYDMYHKQNPFSPFIMALCRALIYILTGFAVSSHLSSDLFMICIAIVIYLSILTKIAKNEHLGKSGVSSRFWYLALLLPLFLYFGNQNWDPSAAIPFLLFYLFWLGFALWPLFQAKKAIGKTVVRLIAGICILDAIVIAGTGAPVFALISMGLFTATLYLQRYAAGT